MTEPTTYQIQPVALQEAVSDDTYRRPLSKRELEKLAKEMMASTVRIARFAPFVKAAVNRGTARRVLRQHLEAEKAKYDRCVAYLERGELCNR
jgi:hypothetical protein